MSTPTGVILMERGEGVIIMDAPRQKVINAKCGWLCLALIQTLLLKDHVVTNPTDYDRDVFPSNVVR